MNENSLPKQDEADYDNISNLPYLDMVINETLRKYPPCLRYVLHKIFPIKKKMKYKQIGYLLQKYIQRHVMLFCLLFSTILYLVC